MDAYLKNPAITSQLAPYACHENQSGGRQHPEATPVNRNQYQRDRDRVIHCAAFRRLEYKTQVFVNHEGDLFRTRLTHSIEVAQIARSIARVLGLHEDLVEAISLAHDLGHTPFGHAGQDALNECMHKYGGFEHNLQSLRVIDLLEEKYAEFDGLNLMFETREGILKRCTKKSASALGALGKRFLQGTNPSLEAQLTNICDEIAYNNHDVDDGLRSGLINIKQLLAVPLFEAEYHAVQQQFSDLTQKRHIHETIRRMINRQAIDLVSTTQRNIAEANPRSAEDVRSHPKPMVHFSTEMKVLHTDIKRFLRKKLYHHHRVRSMTEKARQIVTEIFNAYMSDNSLLPATEQQRFKQTDPWAFFEGDHTPRVVADYIAGMTDRFALAEYKRIFQTKESVWEF